mmetsp:Transcript_29632/g.47820  ORF Transcript_29632/g.47820 Transcript_29632/m.47820 type:complete len:878 (+) Transcript_29632:140-2773(+)|eukprot:CAMPEP_0184646848 /NCGR_PEP_ID=MMETSP0308-20130426/3636_1 /TAXON_ID=38269 /ORGANISM="Gloeochaete witrockiana, Strain SAG 46.84" /LENGTH=877 /DNA_ID=CAMNT_0027077267 /DNA_START=94 /DNA_END=2727 /DNA_ORIENTATION=+
MSRIFSLVVSLSLLIVSIEAAQYGGSGSVTIRSSTSTTSTVLELRNNAASANADDVITVTFDAIKVPSVSASTLPGALAGMGYAQAILRMFQMDQFRNVAKGTLAEFLGPTLSTPYDNVGSDIYFRTLGLKLGSERDARSVTPAYAAPIDAHLAGINAYIESLVVPSGLPVEYFGIGYTQRPTLWTRVDTFALIRLGYYGNGLRAEDILKTTQIALVLGMDRFNELYVNPDSLGHFPETFLKGSDLSTPPNCFARPPRPRTRGASHLKQTLEEEVVVETDEIELEFSTPGTTTVNPDHLKEFASMTTGMSRFLDGWASPTFLDGKLHKRSDGGGSNEVVVRPVLTKYKNSSLLAGDVHQRILFPDQHIEFGSVRIGELETTGMSGPAGPGFLSGCTSVTPGTKSYCWTITSALETQADDMYLIIPVDDNSYLYDGQPKAYRKRTESINIKGSPVPYTFAVKETVHGPIINDAFFLPADSPLFAYQQPTYAIVMKSHEAFLGFAQPHVQGFICQFLKTELLLNLMVVSGRDIYYAHGGLRPIRTIQLTPLNPTTPVAAGTFYPIAQIGAISATNWAGFIPPSARVYVVNPPRGYLVNGNSRTHPLDYPYFVGFGTVYGSRTQRLVDLIWRQREQHTFDTIQQAQLDTVSIFAVRAIRKLKQLRCTQSKANSLKSLLTGWDGDYKVTSVEATAFETFKAILLDKIWADEFIATNATLLLGLEGGLSYVFNELGNIFIASLMDKPAALFWDNVLTPQVETNVDIVCDALNTSYNSTYLPWGPAHPLIVSVYGTNVPLGPIGGTHDSPNQQRPLNPRRGDFKVRTGAQFRFVAEVARAGAVRSKSRSRMGSSGGPLDPLAFVEAPFYLSGTYKPGFKKGFA